MKVRRISASQVLYLGPGFTADNIVPANSIKIASTRELVFGMFPMYFDLDVPRKAHQFREVIDKGVDLSISARILLNLPQTVSVVSDRISPVFHSCLTDGGPSIFIFTSSLDGLKSRWSNNNMTMTQLMRKIATMVDLAQATRSVMLDLKDSRAELRQIIALVSSSARAYPKWSILPYAKQFVVNPRDVGALKHQIVNVESGAKIGETGQGSEGQGVVLEK